MAVKTKTCPYCGKEFETWQANKKYCSFTCAHEHAKPKKAAYHKEWERKRKEQNPAPKSKKKCLVCGKLFEGGNRLYCSRKCVDHARRAMRKGFAPDAPLMPKKRTAPEKEYMALCKEFGRPVHYCAKCGRPTPDRWCVECRPQSAAYDQDDWGYEVVL